jgi:hypothetical protein
VVSSNSVLPFTNYPGNPHPVTTSTYCAHAQDHLTQTNSLHLVLFSTSTIEYATTSNKTNGAAIFPFSILAAQQTPSEQINHVVCTVIPEWDLIIQLRSRCMRSVGCALRMTIRRRRRMRRLGNGHFGNKLGGHSRSHKG